MEPPKRGHYGDRHLSSLGCPLAQQGLQWLGLSVCVCAWISVKSNLTYGASVRLENTATYSAGKRGQNICGDLPKMTVFKSYAARKERKSQ